MAVDEAMLLAHAAGQTPPTLRVYGWTPPAISLGRFQKAGSSVNLDACKKLGVDVCWRPTGGRAILHTQEEVTFSLVISAKRLGTTGVMDSYLSLAEGIVAGMRSLGLDARLVERSNNQSNCRAGMSAGHLCPTHARRQEEPIYDCRAAVSPGGVDISPASPISQTNIGGVGVSPASRVSQDPACFAVKARCDLVVGSSKLVGSAQVQRNGFILQQNSLPLHIHFEEWEKVFHRTSYLPEAVGLCDAVGREITYHEVAHALREGFAHSFGITFQQVEITEWEKQQAEELIDKAHIEKNLS